MLTLKSIPLLSVLILSVGCLDQNPTEDTSSSPSSIEDSSAKVVSSFNSVSGCSTDNSGQLIYVLEDSQFYTCVGEAWEAIDLRGLRGEKGLQGAQGDRGLAGDKGLRGDKGLDGDKGETGDKGAMGDKGPQGDQGIQGPQGIAGDKGETGDKGPTGSRGPTGGATAGRFALKDASGAVVAYYIGPSKASSYAADVMLTSGEIITVNTVTGKFTGEAMVYLYFSGSSDCSGTSIYTTATNGDNLKNFMVNRIVTNGYRFFKVVGFNTGSLHYTSKLGTTFGDPSVSHNCEATDVTWDSSSPLIGYFAELEEVSAPSDFSALAPLVFEIE